MAVIRDKYSIDEVAIRMVRERPLLTNYPINSPEAAIRMVNDLIKDWDRECMIVVNLQNNLVPINMSICSIGAINASIASPREILKSTILSSASRIMLFHLHPSMLPEQENGKITPSAEDIQLTDRMQKICSLIDTPIIDHIIISPNDRYYSFYQNDTLPIASLNLENSLTYYNFAERSGVPIVAESKSSYQRPDSQSTLQKNIEETTEKLEQGILDFFNSGNFQEYLKVMARFHTYSYSNSILIALQRPTATMLQGYQGWKKNFNRQVRSGEKGIKIFAPAPVKVKQKREVLDPDTAKPILGADGKPVTEEVEVKIPKFKVVTVFDVGQTDGEPLPKLGIKTLTGDVTDFDKLFEAIRRTSKVPIAFEAITSGANGYFHTVENRIAIKEGLSQAHTVKTAIHELLHSRLDKKAPGDLPTKEGEEKTRSRKEVIAESVAFVVLSHFQHDYPELDSSDYSFGYIASWSANKELQELKASLQEIRDESAAIINEIEGHLQEIELEQRLSAEVDLNVEDSIEKLAADIAAFSKEYDPYEYQDSVDDESTFAAEVEEFLVQHDTTGLKAWLQNIARDDDEFGPEAAKLIDRIDAITEEPEVSQNTPTVETGEISFYAAECAEFPNMGELHEHLSLEEALQIYEQIPADRMSAVKCVGFELSGTADHDGKFPLMQGGEVQTRLVNMVPFFRENSLVQQALTDVGRLMEERAQTAERSFALNTPVYPKSLLEARSAGEMAEYRNSYKANTMCADEFNKNFGKAYADHKVPEFLNTMVEKYGMERCKIVLASTIQLAPYDKRYTPAIREAASHVFIPEAKTDGVHDRRIDYQLSCHPVTVNMAFRDLIAMEMEAIVADRPKAIPQPKEKEVAKKPSVLKKLRDNQAAIAAAGKGTPQVTHDKPHL